MLRGFSQHFYQAFLSAGSSGHRKVSSRRTHLQMSSFNFSSCCASVRLVSSSASVAPLPPSSSRERSERVALKSIATVIMRFNNRAPLSKIAQEASGAINQEVQKAGKGMEGYFKSKPDVYKVLVDEKGVKCVSLVNPPSYSEVTEEDPIIPPPPVLNGQVVKAVEWDYAGRGRVQDRDWELSVDHTIPVKGDSELHNRLLFVMVPRGTYHVKQLNERVFGSQATRFTQERIADHAKANPGYFLFLDSKTLLLKLKGMPDNAAEISADQLIAGKYMRTKEEQQILNSKVKNVHVLTCSMRLQTKHTKVLTEILRYTPVTWVPLNQVGAQIPANIKLEADFQNVSFIRFVVGLPRFFELKFDESARTLYVRRAVRLHPKENGMTTEEAEEYVANKLRDNHSYKQHVAFNKSSHHEFLEVKRRQ